MSAWPSGSPSSLTTGRRTRSSSSCRTSFDAVRRERLLATATTGALIAERFPLEVERVAPGPLDGDLQIGALVAAGEVKMVIFLRDPLTAHPHDPDIQALMKVCDVCRVPLATNLATAKLCLQALEAVEALAVPPLFLSARSRERNLSAEQPYRAASRHRHADRR